MFDRSEQIRTAERGFLQRSKLGARFAQNIPPTFPRVDPRGRFGEPRRISRLAWQRVTDKNFSQH